MTYYLNKTVWVTGASSGIGEALIPDLLAAGANVILSARRDTELQRVFTANGGDATRMMILPMDVARHHELSEKTKRALAWKGNIDILINNAGVSQRAFAHDTTLEIEKKSSLTSIILVP